MNIEEYRAMKAELEKEKDNPEGGASSAQTNTSTDGKGTSEQEETSQTEVNDGKETKPTKDNETKKPPEEEVKTELPETIEIDGKDIPIDELKNGYLRQSDYTRKTQQARRKEEQADEALEFIKKIQTNPQIAEQLSKEFELPNIDPNQANYRQLEDKYFDLLIETELGKLENKYGDIDAKEILDTARDNNIEDLEVAYHVVQSRKGGGATSQDSQVDIEKTKEELRKEILQELKQEQDNKVDTSTIVQSGGDKPPLQDNTPKLSQAEVKVAKGMGMSPTEYAKWRNTKKK